MAVSFINPGDVFGGVSVDTNSIFRGSGFEGAIRSTIAVWLEEAITDLVANLKRLARKKTLAYSVNWNGPHIASVSITDNSPTGPFGLETWAFGKSIIVPQGGFKPNTPGGKFLIKKPWGETVIRSSIYNKFSGGNISVSGGTGNGISSPIRGMGFALHAINATFTQQRLDVLASHTATMVSFAVANKIQKAFALRGVASSVVSVP